MAFLVIFACRRLGIPWLVGCIVAALTLILYDLVLQEGDEE